ncbi:6-phospho-3-hexuloisomerase [Methanobrevibacter boviskoreani]|uniref:6-phospho-3-hexuloisomerase n=1 Tax=Methanobrevibacter boviskoreani TaxID=1348249 RepID=UPI00059349AC|nr:6-phospho-3-hexuloisomerase [Methanobrevibacter boviskoreani]MCI6931106.1 6-phospho-3-hexuloisomerase [Methanobrevibacter boviskoreani]MDD6256207.1 6-phospho-3-hexuloisomerase [Methanobrevibacter boviskoreani]
MELMKSSIEAIIENVKEAETYLDNDEINNFMNEITNAENVFVIGAGRSGLVAKAFAMRLMHLGISAYVVGETISPAINDEDCILAISGSGETNTIVSAAKTSKKRGARILSLTSYPKSSLGKISDVSIYVRGRTKAEADDKNYLKRQIDGNYTSLTPLGTAFELTSLIFLDGLICELMNRLGKTENDLKKRHAVLE